MKAGEGEDGGAGRSGTRLVEGRTLDEDVTAYGRLTEDAATLVARDLLADLASVHAAGVVHGDVRAGNVVLTGTGEALLTGFAATDGTPADDLRALGEILRESVAHGGLEPLITWLVTDPSTAAEAFALLPRKAEQPPPAPAAPSNSAGVVGALLAVLGVILVMIIIGSTLHTSTPDSASTTDNYVADTTTTSEPTTTTETTTTEETTTTTTFDSASLDEKATDDTPLTPSALLPEQFTDGQNVTYTRRSAGSQDGCDNAWATQQVLDILDKAGCEQRISGTYLDDNDTILVWIAVVPLADTQTAADTQAALRDTHSGDWGAQCPRDGAGSSVCDATQSQFDHAEQVAYDGHLHRYLIHAVSVYANLGGTSDQRKWVDAAADAAVDAAGPRN